MNINDLKPLENNPFKNTDAGIERIKESINQFKKMMEIRKIIIDENNQIIGGNKRYFALKKLGYKEVPDEWIDKRTDLTEEEKTRFVVTDNADFGGEWDFEMLQEWGVPDQEWGVDIPNFDELNEKDEWDDNDMPEFNEAESELKITIYFESEKKREEYAKEHNITIDKKNMNQWIARP